jgi:hypothetical protein
MMKLKLHHAQSLLLSTRDAKETIKRVESTLKLLDSEMPMRSTFSVRDKSPDSKILYEALNASELLDHATDKMNSTLCSRGVNISDEHRAIQAKQSEIFARIFRILWELTLSEKDDSNFKSLVKSFATLTVWEDAPCILQGLSYAEVVNEHTGVIAFIHCYGVTFVNYEQGKFKDRAWTVLHNTLQSAVIKARKDVKAAKKMLAAYE